MNGASTGWQCPKCTLINNAIKTECAACMAPNPNMKTTHAVRSHHMSNGDGLLNKFPLISNAVAGIDSVIENISTQLNVFTERNRAPQIQNWLCSKCNLINPSSTRYCTTCRFDKLTEDKFFAFKCERCGLKQPQLPLEFKCPLCRKKVSPMLASTSKSMPDLSRPRPNDVPTKPAEDDSLECHQIFTNIVHFCSAAGHSFIDDSFPHSNRSIGDLRALDRQNLNIVWLRPQDIRTKDGRKYRWSIFNDPKSGDIEQGLLGNCWIVSALALIAERPDILERIFVTKEYNSFGVYQIRLCIDGLWRTVVVDDFFPCHADKRMMIFGVGRNNQLWVSLVEKALAKNFGSYSRLRAGRMHEGLSILTGFPCIQVEIDSDDHDSVFVDTLWAKLYSALESNYLIGASCGAGKLPVDEKQYRGLGLMAQHAYSVLNVATISNDRLIQLRNPWGTFVWSGVYGPHWLKSQTDLRRQLEPNGTSSGTFWMPFQCFVKYFDAMEICCVNLNWHVIRYPLNIGWNPTRCGCVRFVVTESTQLFISLFQKSSRSTGLDNIDIMILIHKEDKTKDAFPGELVFNSERRVYDSMNADTILQPGTYMIYAISLSKTIEAFVQPGSLVIHSTKPIHSEILPASMSALRTSLQELVIKHGRIEQTLPNCIARILTTDFAGLVVMVDNLASNQTCQVQSDCQNSTNVVSTRGNLLTFDSIPPLHRQILTVLSHLENTQPFSVSHRMQVKLSSMPTLGNTMFPQVPSAQHIPGFCSDSIFALHGPTPLYS